MALTSNIKNGLNDIVARGHIDNDDLHAGFHRLGHQEGKGVILGLFLEPAGLPCGFLVGGFVRGSFSRGWFVAGDGGQRGHWEEELVWLSQEDVKS